MPKRVTQSLAALGIALLAEMLSPALARPQADLPPVERVTADSTSGGRVLSFIVLDAASRAPVGYVLVCALDKSGAFGISDSTGRVGLGGLADGDLSFRLIAPGYDPRDIVVRWMPQERSAVRAALRKAAQSTPTPKCPTW